MPDFVHELRVRYGECDPQGIVFNPNYLAYFDHTVTELWRASEIGSWDAMVERGLDVVVGEANVRFRAPARFDDLIAVHARVAKFGTTSGRSSWRSGAATALLIEGWLRQVFVDAKTWRKTRDPGLGAGGARRLRGLTRPPVSDAHGSAEPADHEATATACQRGPDAAISRLRAATTSAAGRTRSPAPGASEGCRGGGRLERRVDRAHRVASAGLGLEVLGLGRGGQ